VITVVAIHSFNNSCQQLFGVVVHGMELLSACMDCKACLFSSDYELILATWIRD
jgi:hypothetical protein